MDIAFHIYVFHMIMAAYVQQRACGYQQQGRRDAQDNQPLSAPFILQGAQAARIRR